MGKRADNEIACPACGYSLRGLGAEHVVCPECGLRSLPAEIVENRGAALLRLLRAPAWVLWIGTLLALGLIAYEAPFALPAVTGLALVTLGIWASLVRRAVRRMGTWWAIAAVLALHVVALGQVGLPLLGLALAAVCVDGGNPAVFIPLAGACVALAVLTFWLDGRLERWLRRKDVALLRELRAR